MLTVGEAPAGLDLWRARLAAAIAFRPSLGIDATACRLVHGEGDLLPSLVVDQYGEYLVVQALSQGVDRLLPDIVGAARRTAEAGRDPRAQRRARPAPRGPRLVGHAAARRGAGTRARARGPRSITTSTCGTARRRACSSTSARTAWPRARTPTAGCSTASATTAPSPCSWPTAASRWSPSTCRRTRSAHIGRNAARNGIGNIEARAARTCSTRCGTWSATGERFDTIVLDPPAFAKSKDAVEKAYAGYKEINLRAMKLLQARRHPRHLHVLLPRRRGVVRPDRRTRRRSTRARA